jgi:hypothetical protein
MARSSIGDTRLRLSASIAAQAYEELEAVRLATDPLHCGQCVRKYDRLSFLADVLRTYLDLVECHYDKVPSQPHLRPLAGQA